MFCNCPGLKPQGVLRADMPSGKNNMQRAVCDSRLQGCRRRGTQPSLCLCPPPHYWYHRRFQTITERHGRWGVHGSGILLHSPSKHSRDRYHPVTSAPACLRASATTSCDRGQLHSVAPHAWLVVSPHRDARAFTCHLCSSTPLQARWRPVNHALFVSF